MAAGSRKLQVRIKFMIASQFPLINALVTIRLLFLLSILTFKSASADDLYPGLQVGESRTGSLYTFTASFDTALSKCEAFNFLTDYAAAKNLPGIVESIPHRLSPSEVKVDRTAVEEILFFHVSLHSVLKYVERPFDGVSFTQVSGNSKIYKGSWAILPKDHGTTLKFVGYWEPDTLMPDFVIDHFAKSELAEKFSAVAHLSEKKKYRAPSLCKEPMAKGMVAIRLIDTFLDN